MTVISNEDEFEKYLSRRESPKEITEHLESLLEFYKSEGQQKIISNLSCILILECNEKMEVTEVQSLLQISSSSIINIYSLNSNYLKITFLTHAQNYPTLIFNRVCHLNIYGWIESIRKKI